jgi:putative endonuclease
MSPRAMLNYLPTVRSVRKTNSSNCEPGLEANRLGVRTNGMGVWARIKSAWSRRAEPLHLHYGKLGEREAKRYLQRLGLKFLVANYSAGRSEIDLIFRDQTCLVFVEVKTRSSEAWTRPAAAVNAKKRRLLSRAALQYLHRIRDPEVPIRFDIVEVLLADGTVREIRHLPNTFSLSSPYRYG